MAAEAAFTGNRTVTPKTRDGMVEALRMLHKTRQTAVRGLAGWRSHLLATPCLLQEVASPFGEQVPAMYGRAGP